MYNKLTNLQLNLLNSSGDAILFADGGFAHTIKTTTTATTTIAAQR